ncbi:hypothetical protein SSX86_019741 [Deinandra increscens subsp. villosa]|uniref:RIN4 pathogenic type III effector avirulence factor Avr cleavage site domain-containing protein n=1 Tax=Deinandra increscens subsp. villosa TaxID=3103831 RepID=A0AAP0CTD8_9ASTR
MFVTADYDGSFDRIVGNFFDFQRQSTVSRRLRTYNTRSHDRWRRLTSPSLIHHLRIGDWLLAFTNENSNSSAKTSKLAGIMAQHPKVPKFGDWEGQDDVPYTVYFEKAKKNRKSKTNTQIPDPSSKEEPSFEVPEEAQIRYGDSAKSEPEKPKGTRMSRGEVDLRKSTEPPSQPKRISRPSAGSVQSFDNSPVHPPYQTKARNRGSVSSESSYGAGSTPGRTRVGQVSRGDETADDGPAIPKFGDWDDNNPASAEQYTEVFNKARQDKHGGGGKSPIITSENANYFGQRNEKSKGCGCFPWGGK